MKQYLLVMIIFLAVAIVSGVVVWYLYQDIGPGALERRFEAETSTGVREQSNVPAVDESTAPEATHTISVDALTPAQRSMLQSFGINSSEFVITETLLTCAKTGVGEGRLDEILNGSAPTPFEAMKLLPCVKAR